MKVKHFLAFLSLACLLLGAGCAGHSIKESEPDAGAMSPNQEPVGYGHPFRLVAFFVHPVGLLTDLIIVRPIYWIGSLAPGVFGYTPEDEAAQEAARRY